MSILVTVCRIEQGLPGDNVTADLRLKFVKPIPTPSAVLLNAKINEIKNERKYYASAEIMNEKGTVLAHGQGLFVHVSATKL